MSSHPNDTSGPSEGFRPLSQAERNILAVLLAADFPGKTELVEQASTITARRIDEDGSLEFSGAMGPPAKIVRRIPVEAEAEDRDGATIHVLLHVVDGFMKELELYRDGEGSVQQMPLPENLRVVLL